MLRNRKIGYVDFMGLLFSFVFFFLDRIGCVGQELVVSSLERIQLGLRGGDSLVLGRDGLGGYFGLFFFEFYVEFFRFLQVES